MQSSGDQRREIAKSYSVVIVRERGRSSIPETAMIESRKPRRTGCPAFAGHDGPGCSRRPLQAGANAWTPVML